MTAAYHALIEVLPDSGDILLEAAEAAERAGDPKAAQRWFDEVAVLPGTGQALAMAARLSAAELLAEQDRSLESLERLDVILRATRSWTTFEDLRARAETLALRLEIARHDRQLTQNPRNRTRHSRTARGCADRGAGGAGIATLGSRCRGAGAMDRHRPGGNLGRRTLFGAPSGPAT